MLSGLRAMNWILKNDFMKKESHLKKRLEKSTECVSLSLKKTLWLKRICYSQFILRNNSANVME